MNNNSRSAPNPSVQLVGMVTNAQILGDKDWYPDSGATSHVTPDNTNLITQNACNDLEKVCW